MDTTETHQEPARRMSRFRKLLGAVAIAVPLMIVGASAQSSPVSACATGGSYWSTYSHVTGGDSCSGRIGTQAKLWAEPIGSYWGGYKYSNANSYTYNWHQTTSGQANCGNC